MKSAITGKRTAVFILSLFFLFFYNSAEAQNYIAYQDTVSKLYGYQDVNGNQLIPAKFSTAKPFRGNLATIRNFVMQPDGRKQSRWGMIDKKGNEVIPVEYEDSKYIAEYITFFAEGLAPVEKQGRMGYIDESNKAIIPFEYEVAFPFSEGLAAVVKEGRIGFIDKKGAVVIPFLYHYNRNSIYDRVIGFSEGLVAVEFAGSSKDFGSQKWQFIDHKGETMIDLAGYSGAFNFREGLSLVTKYINGKLHYGFINKKKEEIVPLKYHLAFPFKDGLARVNIGAVITMGGKFGFIDKTGKEVIPLIYDNARDFSEGLAVVNKGGYQGLGGKNGYINQAGKEVIPPQYFFAMEFQDGLALVALTYGNYRYINKQNEVVTLKGVKNAPVVKTATTTSAPAATTNTAPIVSTLPATASRPPSVQSTLSSVTGKKKYETIVYIVGSDGTLEETNANEAWHDKNTRLAVFWYEAAAAKGHARSMTRLAIMNADGSMGKTDEPVALKWLEKAVAKEEPLALFWKSTFYKSGLAGFQKDEKTELELLKKAAAKGSVDAQKALGQVTPGAIIADAGSKGNGNEELTKGMDAWKRSDYIMAAEWYKKAMDKGSVPAITNLGVMYREGKGVKQDLNEAFRLYTMAAEKGSAAAMQNLGILHQGGAMGTKNYPEAIRWYKLAAEKGNTVAMINLGVMYANGEGVAVNEKEAYQWYLKCAQAGDSRGMVNVAVAMYKGAGTEKDAAAALYWLEKAAALDNLNAMFNLGVLYADARAGLRDIKKAREWYQKAEAKGDRRATEALALLNASN